MSLSTTNESSSKADQIAHKFFTKFALLLHHARATPHIPGPRLDKWFNLETPDTDQFRDRLRMYRSISTSVSLPPFELQILLSVPELATNQVLVLSDNNTARSRVDPTPSHVLLESWVVEFSPDRDSRRYDDRPDVALSSVYKQSISVFRSMFTLLRVLPAWRLFKRLRRGTGSPESSHLGIQVRVADPNNESRMLKFGSPVSSSAASPPTSTHAFPPVSHPFGTLTISTTYLLSPFFHIDTLESLLSSRFLSQDDESFTPTIAARQQSSLSGSPNRNSLARSPPGPSLADRFVLPANTNTTGHASPLRGPLPVSLSRNNSGGSGSTGSRPVSVLPPSADSPRSGSGSGSPRFGPQGLPETAGPQPIRRPSINAIHPFKSSTLGSPSLHSPTTSSHRQSPLSTGPSLPSRPPAAGPLSSSPSMRTRLSSSPGSRPTYPPAPPSPMSARAPSTRPSPPDPSRPATGKRYSSTFGHRYASAGGTGSDSSPGKKSDERPGSASFLSTTTDDDDISAFVQAIDARPPLSNKRQSKREESESTETGAEAQPEKKADQVMNNGNGSGTGTVRKYKDHVDDELRRMNDAFMQSLVGLEGRPRRDNGRGRGGSVGIEGHSRESPTAPVGASPSPSLPPLPDSPVGRGSPLRPSLTLYGGSSSPSGSASPSASGREPSHHRAGSAASGSDEIIGRLEFDERPGSRGGYARPYR